MTGATDDREAFPSHFTKHKRSDINGDGNSGGNAEPNMKRLKTAGGLEAVSGSKLLATKTRLSVR